VEGSPEGFTFIDDLLQSALFPDGIETESGGEGDGNPMAARAIEHGPTTATAAADSSHDDNTSWGRSGGGGHRQHCSCHGIQTTARQPGTHGEPGESSTCSNGHARIRKRAQEEPSGAWGSTDNSSAEPYTGEF
jgi:hypothetical protein